MQDTGFSRYALFANTEKNWLPMDTEELYREHLRTRRSDLEQYGWIDRTFTYRFNEHGFRSDAFDQGEGIMFLGCSMTLGTGLPWEDTWPYQISQRLGLRCWNLAQGGTGNDTMFRLALNWLPKLKPRMVMLMATANERFEIIEGKTSTTLMPTSRYPAYLDFYKNWITTESNCLLNRHRNLLAIERLCSQANIPLLIFDWSDLCRWGNEFGSYIDYARDLAHPGPTTMKMFVSHVLDRLSNG